MRRAVFIVISTVLPLSVLAHGAGSSFEKVVNGRLVDIGYDVPLGVSEDSLMDFAIYDMKGDAITGLADFDEVRLSIFSGSTVQLTRTLTKPDFGKVFASVQPSAPGNWILRAGFFRSGAELASADFAVDIPAGTPTFQGLPEPLVFALIALLLASVAYAGFALRTPRHGSAG
jgi:hypothetical protein